MSDVSTTLGLFDPFVYEGTEYKIERRKFRTEGVFELWLKKQARDDLRNLWADLPEYTEMLRIFQQDCAAQVYAFTSWNSLRAQGTLPGIVERCYLDLIQANPRATRDLVRKIFEDPNGTPTGKTAEDGSPEIETFADELVRRLREANAPPLPRTPPAPTAATETATETSPPLAAAS